MITSKTITINTTTITITTKTTRPTTKEMLDRNATGQRSRK